MLVLSRKVGERLAIGERVLVTVVAVRGSQVRLGVEAPVEVIVLRDELSRTVAHEKTSSVRKQRLPRIPHGGPAHACKEAGR